MLQLNSKIVSPRLAGLLLSGVSGVAMLAASAPAAAKAGTAGTAAAGQTAPQPRDQSTIVVTGRRAALESADRRKKNADAIIDSVVADEAGKLPDNSITEVLQRVQGVAIVRFAALNDPDHFSVEGSGLQVRGLSGVASRLNGREIFSANAGRALLWGDVTPELMAAVDVYKSSTADLIEGGTGGQIDLRTKMPFDYRKLTVAGSIGGGYGDLSKKFDYNASGLVTDRFTTGIGEFGILVDLAYSNLSSRSDFFRTEPYFRQRINNADYFIPGGVDFGSENFNRKRTGIYGAVQWAPSSSLQFYGTFFQSRYRNRAVNSGAFITSQNLVADPSSSTFDDNNALISSTSLFVRNQQTFLPAGSTLTTGGNTGVQTGETETRDISGGFKWTPGDSPLTVTGAVQHVQSEADVDRYDVFRNAVFPATFGLDLSGDLPQMSVAPASQTTIFDQLTNYTFSATQPHAERNHGSLDAVNLDGEYKLSATGFFKSVKVGGRWADRSERDLNNGFAWAALGTGGTSGPVLTYANARPGDVAQVEFDNFFRGGVALPGILYFPTPEWVSRMDRVGDHTKPPAGFCPTANGGVSCASAGPTPTGYGGPNIRTPGFILPNDQTDYSTKTLAGYAMVRFGSAADSGGLQYDGNAGVRVVNLRNSSSGYFTQNVNTFIRDGVQYRTTQVAAVRSGGAEFTRVLPSVNFQLLPSPDVHIRAAYNVTMDLPSFTALRAQGSLGVNTTLPQGSPAGTLPNFNFFTASTGNPDLKPVMSNNFDLSFEWYPKRGTTLHLAGFYKRISDLIVYKATTRPVQVFYDQPTVTSTIEQATTTDVDNSDEIATVKGLEIGGRIFLDMLPGALSGLGLEANYTFIDSKSPGDQYTDILGVIHRDLPIQGLSRNNFNATLLYEKGRFSARLAYSWRSKYLMSTTANGTTGSYRYYAFARPSNTVTPTAYALPIYGDAYGQLDAGLQIKLNNHLSWSLEGTNVLNATQRTLMGGINEDHLYVRSWFQSDRRVSTSLRFNF